MNERASERTTTGKKRLKGNPLTLCKVLTQLKFWQKKLSIN